MKKIGILTFHRAINYGAVLQTYGLSETVKKLGAKAEVIDYRCDGIEDYYYNRISLQKSLKENIKSVLLWKKQKKRNREFEAFIKKYIPVTSSSYHKGDNLDILEFDEYVVGSDQVWNYKCIDGDKAYLLDFVSENKKNSYAASLGKMTQEQFEYMDFKKNLAGYKNISVREESAATKIQSITDRQIDVMPDPTILLDLSSWSKIANSIIKEKYVFVYSVNMPNKVFQLARKLSDMLGVKLVYATLENKFHSSKGIDMSECGPETFLGLIRNAEYVVTNSFHGSVFSIIFHKQFFTVYNDENGLDNTRLVSLLRKLGLEDRACDDCEDIDNQINYDEVEEKLSAWREQGLLYLKRIIEDLK